MPLVGGTARPRPARPDPVPLRVAFGMGGLAAASALFATIATSATPVAADPATLAFDPGQTTTTAPATTGGGSAASGTSGTQGTTSKPASTPAAVATQLPAAQPRPRRVVVVTRQSGQP